MFQKRNLTSLILLGWLGLSLSGCACQTRRCRPGCEAKPAPAPLPANITPLEAKALLDQNAGHIYLDVRSVEEFNEGHVPGSWNIPVLFMNRAAGTRSSNENFVDEVAAAIAKDAALIVGCRSGSRSQRALKMLREAGYTNMTNVVGGYIGRKNDAGEFTQPGWSTLGLPSEAGDGGEFGYASLKAKSKP